MLTDQLVKQILQQPYTLERLLKWSIELSKFYIEYKPRMEIKAQVLADFVAEFTYDVTPEPKENLLEMETWQSSG